MQTMWKAAKAFLVNEDGATLTEYAIMIALISVICLAAITTVGTGSRTTFTRVAAGF